MEIAALLVAGVASCAGLRLAWRKGITAVLSLVFFAGTLGIHSVAPILAPQVTFLGRELVTFDRAAQWAAASTLGCLLAYAMPGSRSSESILPQWVKAVRPKLGVIVAGLALGVVGLVVYAISLTGSLASFVESSRFAGRGEGNPFGAVLGLTVYRAAPIALILGLLSGNTRTRRATWLLGLVSFAGLTWFLKGTRAQPVGLLGAMLLVGWTTANRRTLRTRRLGAIVLGLVVLAVSLVGIRSARHREPDEGFVSALQRGVAEAASAPGTLLGSDPFNYHAILVATSDSAADIDAPFLGPLRRTVFAPLPTGWMGLKPPDTNSLVAEAIGSEDATTIVPPTVAGEGFLTLGRSILSSFVWGFCYGVGLRWLERAALRSTAVGLAVASASVEIGLLATRGQFFETSVRLGQAVLVAALFVALLGSRRSSRRPKRDHVSSRRRPQAEMSSTM